MNRLTLRRLWELPSCHADADGTPDRSLLVRARSAPPRQAKIVRQESQNIDALYDKKRKQAETGQKMCVVVPCLLAGSVELGRHLLTSLVPPPPCLPASPLAAPSRQRSTRRGSRFCARVSSSWPTCLKRRARASRISARTRGSTSSCLSNSLSRCVVVLPLSSSPHTCASRIGGRSTDRRNGRLRVSSSSCHRPSPSSPGQRTKPSPRAQSPPRSTSTRRSLAGRARSRSRTRRSPTTARAGSSSLGKATGSPSTTRSTSVSACSRTRCCPRSGPTSLA